MNSEQEIYLISTFCHYRQEHTCTNTTPTPKHINVLAHIYVHIHTFMKKLMSLFPIQVVEKTVKENKAHVWRWWPNRGMIKTALNRENYDKPKLSLKKMNCVQDHKKKDER